MNTGELEQVIVEVIRRLAAANVASCATSGADDSPRETTSSLAAAGGVSGLPVRLADAAAKPDRSPLACPGENASFKELLVEDRVLTLAKLDGKLEGIRRLIVPRKAIVTPAVREELSRRGIVIEQVSSSGSGKKLAATSGIGLSLLHLDLTIKFDLRKSLDAVEELGVRTLPELIAETQLRIRRGDRLVLALCRNAAAVCCALNRSCELRAAVVTNTESLREALKSLAPNVLVIDPQRIARLQLTAIAREFVKHGPAEIPESLRGIVSP